jgi:hypothetical protein
MTYSNRPVSSPFQHRSEFDKSDNSISERKKNPIAVENMPGATSASYTYDKPEPPPLNGESSKDDPEPSPICEWATTMGDNTISLCKPPYKYDKELSCPMTRPLEPQRRIDPGMWVYNKKEKVVKTDDKKVLFCSIIFILFIIFALLQISHKK